MEKKCKTKWLQAGIKCFIAMVFCCTVFSVNAGKARESIKIRVGFPQLEGSTWIDEDGNYSGYTYEYLQRIAQYTNWEYEFVQTSQDLNEDLTNLMEMLKTGEIDIMGGVNYFPHLERDIDFSDQYYGVAYSTLLVLNGNKSISSYNYASLNGIRIGVLGHAKTKREGLNRFLQSNNLEAEFVLCDTNEQLLEMMQSGMIDAMLSLDMLHIPNTRVVAKFYSMPYYFATSKQNPLLLQGLNSALLKIGQTDPYFGASLYSKYYEPLTNEIVLSDAESEFIASASPIPVVAVTEGKPLQYFDERGEFSGISNAVMEHIEQKTGLSFEILPAKDYDEAMRMVADGEALAVLGVPYDYQLAKTYHLLLTNAYLSSQKTLVIHQSLDIDDIYEKQKAVVSGTLRGQVENAVYYKTFEECIEAVSKGEAAYAESNVFVAEYAIRSSKTPEVVLLPVNDEIWEYCIGLSSNANVQLVSILNKAIYGIDNMTLQTMIFQNTAQISAEKMTLYLFIQQNPMLCIIFVLLIACIILACFYQYMRIKLRVNERIDMERKRYLQLCDLGNEFIFEYNYKKDILELSDNFSKQFGLQKRYDHFQTSKHVLQGVMQEILNGLQQDNNLYEVCIPFEDKLEYHFRVFSAKVYDVQGALSCLIGKVTDIQDGKEENQIIIEKSKRDGLTGLYHATSTREAVEEKLKQRKPEMMDAMIIFDIDHFKMVNDQLGHYTGDIVLKDMADLLQNTFDDQTVIGRLGGDEFLIFMESTSYRKVEVVCQLLCEKAHRNIRHKGIEIAVTLSVGAIMVDRDTSFEMLYQAADAAMYTVKGRGRNSYTIIQMKAAAV